MKYIVELRTTRRYEDVEADSAIEAVMAVKRNPDFDHTHVEENADVYVPGEHGEQPSVLSVYSPRRWDNSMAINSQYPSPSAGTGRI